MNNTPSDKLNYTSDRKKEKVDPRLSDFNLPLLVEKTGLFPGFIILNEINSSPFSNNSSLFLITAAFIY